VGEVHDISKVITTTRKGELAAPPVPKFHIGLKELETPLPIVPGEKPRPIDACRWGGKDVR